MRKKWDILVCGADEPAVADLCWWMNLSADFLAHQADPSLLAAMMLAIEDLRMVVILPSGNDSGTRGMVETALRHGTAAVMVLGASPQLREAMQCSALMLPSTSRVGLLEMLRVVSARRRGPKKGAPRKISTVSTFAAENHSR